MAHRSDDACLGWWVKCGHFDITYPDYHKYYVDLKHMAGHIQRQNRDILSAWRRHSGTTPKNNQELSRTLGIDLPPVEYQQDYKKNNIKVMVI
jgi:hypothetical protein